MLRKESLRTFIYRQAGDEFESRVSLLKHLAARIRVYGHISVDAKFEVFNEAATRMFHLLNILKLGCIQTGTSPPILSGVSTTARRSNATQCWLLMRKTQMRLCTLKSS